MKKKIIKCVTPALARRAMQRRLPTVMNEINNKIRNGCRCLIDDLDFEVGFYPFIVSSLREAGWEVKLIEGTSYIRIRTQDEPKFNSYS